MGAPLAAPVDPVIWREGGDAGGLAGGGPNTGQSNCLSCAGVTTYRCPNVGSSDSFWMRPVQVSIPNGARVVGVEAKVYGASVLGTATTTSVPVFFNALPLGTISSRNRNCNSGTPKVCDGGDAGVVILTSDAGEDAIANSWKTDGGNQLIFQPSTNNYCLSQLQLTLQLEKRILQVSPGEIDFGNQGLGKRSGYRTVTVSNQGAAPLDVDGLAITLNGGVTTSAPFVIEKIGDGGTADVSFTLQEGETKDIVLSFTPSGLGAAEGYQLAIASNSAQATTNVPLLGTGVDFFVDISSPDGGDFGPVRVGQHREFPVKVRNIDSQELSIESIDLDIDGSGVGLSFQSDAGTPFTLPQGAEHSLVLKFDPIAPGEVSGTLRVISKDAIDASTTTEAVFTGEGVEPHLVFTPDAGLDFGEVTAGEVNMQNMMIRNTGSEGLTLQSVRVRDNPDAFQLLSAPDGSVPLPADGGSLALTVRFLSPDDAGIVSGALEFVSTDGGLAPVLYNLTGKSVRPDLVLEPAGGGAFGDVRVYTTPQKTVTLRNQGTGNIHINTVQLVGGASLFDLDGGTSNFDLPGDGGFRNFTVRFNPTTETGPTPVQGEIQVASAYSRFNPLPYSVSGRGVRPELVFTPTDGGSFGEVRVGQSPQRKVTLWNKGSGSIQINQVGLSVDSSPLFSLDAGTSGFTLAADAGQELWVGFHPGAETGGGVAGAITVSSDDAGFNPTPYPLSGMGVQPVLDISADGGSDFGDVLVNNTPTKQVTIRNTGSQDIVIKTVSLSDNSLFEVVSPPSNFPLVKGGGQRSVTVRFSPTVATSLQEGTLAFTSEDTQLGLVEYKLQGRGVRPDLVVEPTDGGMFDDVRVGKTAYRTVKLKNNGTTDVTVTSVAVLNNGHFLADAGSSSFPLTRDGGSRDLTLRFAPTDDNVIEEGQLSFATNPSGFQPALFPLRGRGVQPHVELTPASEELDFEEVRVNTDGGATRLVQLRNRGTGSIALSDIKLEGDPAYTLEPALSPPYPTLPALDGGLTLTVRYSPVVQEPAAATTLTLASEDESFGTHEIQIHGQGVRPTLQVDAGLVAFANQTVGEWSAYRNVELRNSGTGTLVVDTFDASGPFELQSAQPLQVTSSAPGSVAVRFKPMSQGAGSGLLTFKTNDPEHSHITVPLSGTGTVGLAVDRDTVAFPDVRNTTQADEPLALNNNNPVASVTITEVSLNSDQFSVVGLDAGMVINPSSPLPFKARFKPTVTGNAQGTLTVRSSANNSPHTVQLQGKSTEARLRITLPEFPAGTSSLNFGGVPVDALAQSHTVRFSNAGDATLNLTGVSIVKRLPDGGILSGDPAFTYSGSLSGELGTDGGVIVSTISFKPSQNTDYSATLVVDTSNGVPLSVDLPLLGQGTAAQISLSGETALSFSPQRVNHPSTARKLYIRNEGSAPLVIQGVSYLEDFYAVASDGGTPFPLTIGSKDTAPLDVVFRPTRTGTRDGGLMFSSNALNTLNPVPVSGQGLDGLLTTDGGTWDVNFGEVELSRDLSSERAVSVRVHNTGQYALTLLDAGINAQGADQFRTVYLQPGTVLQPGESTAFNAIFKPLRNGEQNGVLSIFTDSQLRPVEKFQMTGTGVGANIFFLPGSSIVRFENTNRGRFNIKPVTLKNDGRRELVIDAISFSKKTLPDGGTMEGDAGSHDFASDFSVERAADGGSVFPIRMDAGAQLEIPLKFTPSGVGYREATATISSNISERTFEVNGTGTVAELSVEPDGGTLIIEGVMAGSDSLPRQISIVNVGNGPITFTSIALLGSKEFFKIFPDPETMGTQTLAGDGQGRLQFSVLFHPTATNLNASAALRMASDDHSPSVFVNIYGYGTNDPISVENRLDFRAQLINDASPTRLLPVTNNTEAEAQLTQVKFDGQDAARFSVVSPSPLKTPYKLRRGEPLTLGLSFNPRTTDKANAKLQLYFAGQNDPYEVELVGEGITPAIVVDPPVLKLGAFRLGDEPLEQSFTITNRTGDPITLSKPRISSQGEPIETSLDLTQPLVLNPNNDPYTVMVRYNPKTETFSQTTVSFTAEGKSWGAVARIEGTAVRRVLKVDPPSLDFGRVEANKAGSLKLTVTNESPKDQLVSAVLRNSLDSPFTLDVSPLANPIPSGKSVELTVGYTPRVAGEVENAVLFRLQGGSDDEAQVPIKGVGNILTINGSGCSCGTAEPGSAGLLLLLALVGQRWRRRRE